jgi:hypothetical protein
VGHVVQREPAPRPAPQRESMFRVSTPGDTWEREADSIADAVLNTSRGERAAIRPTPIPATLQRKCSACEEEDQKGLVQRDGEGSVSMTSDVGAAIHGLRGGGDAMSSSARGFFEPRFGHDFARVRIHTDSRAADVARSMQARAFTLGNDIVFGAGQYQPNTPRGQRLLAHELAHVVQQSGGGGSLIQREVDPASATTVTVPTGEPHKFTRITRTVDTRPCTSRNTTEQTPPNQILYWDQQAQAVGFRYTLCHGRVRLATGGSISYEQLLNSATRLLGDVLQNPADLNAAMQRALASASVSGGGQITLTFDGRLEATLSASGNAGASEQGVQVRGRILVAPDGNWRFSIEGGYDFQRNAMGQTSTYTFSGRIGNEQVTLGIDVRHIDFSPVGGPAQRDTQVVPTLSIPLDRPDPVNCRRCDCPPPVPRYQCQPYTEPYSEPVIDRQHDVRTFRLLHLYNTHTPADPAAFQQRLREIADLLAADSHVVSIRGFASPEASVAYNRRLAQQRANHTRTQLEAEITGRRATQTQNPAPPAPTLPAIGESGELLGESSTAGRSEAPDSQLIDELKRRLENLTPDQRLELLGVDQAVRADPVRRQAALNDIDTFIRGSVNGVPLDRRPRWELIFPHLRRTEIVVDIHEQSHIQNNPERYGDSGNCSRDQIAEAERLMPRIPPRQRLPTDEC